MTVAIRVERRKLKSIIAGNKAERRQHILKKDRLDILLELRCRSIGRKNNVIMKKYITYRERQDREERNEAHKKLHHKAKQEARQLRLHDYTKSHEREWHKVPIGQWIAGWPPKVVEGPLNN